MSQLYHTPATHMHVLGSRHVHISAASRHVGPAGEESVAASPGVGDQGVAGPAAAALADDESDDEADREVENLPFQILYNMCQQKHLQPASAVATCYYMH